MGSSRPFLSLLEGYNNPDSQLAECDSDNIEESPDDYAIFYLVHILCDGWISILPLDIDEARENSHHVGGGSNPRLIVELIHEEGLRRKFRVRNWISPIVHHYLNECSKD